MDQGEGLSSAAELARPVLLVDGDCGFCRRRARRLASRVGDRVEIAALQEAGARFPEIGEEELLAELHFIEPDGRVSRGAQAVFRARSYAPGRSPGLWCYERLPGFAALAEWGYRRVARNRALFSRWLGSDPVPTDRPRGFGDGECLPLESGSEEAGAAAQNK